MQMDGDRAPLVAFAAGSILAGGNGVAIRFSNRELDPLWGAGLRFLLAATLLLVLMAALRLALPRGRPLAGAVVFGLLQFGATYALAVMSSAPLEGSLPVLSVVAAIGSALCFAEAAVLVRWLPPVHPVTMNAVGMSAGAVALVVAALVAGETVALPDRSDTWTALGYLVTFGSIGVFLLYLYVLRRWVASRAAYSFVLIPIVTVALSAWLDDEPVGAGLVLGGALVLLGVYVGALREPEKAVVPH